MRSKPKYRSKIMTSPASRRAKLQYKEKWVIHPPDKYSGYSFSHNSERTPSRRRAEIKTLIQKDSMNSVPFKTGIVDIDAHGSNIVNAFKNEFLLNRYTLGLNSENKSKMTPVLDGHIKAELFKAYLVEHNFTYVSITSSETVFHFNEGRSDLLITIESRDKLIAGEFLGKPDLVKQYVEAFETIIGKPPKTAVNYLSVDSQGDIKTRIVNISTRQVDIPHQVFYPFMKVPLDEHYEAFMQSRANVYILIGPPGTGKSTFLSGLISHPGVDAAIAYNDDLFKTSAAIDHFMSSKQNVLILEDVSALVIPRANNNSLMATFLNATNGLANTFENKKIVFSTNLPSLKNIDEALYRPGRCFHIGQFRNLTIDESIIVSTDRGIDNTKLIEQHIEGKTYSLSQVLNPLDIFSDVVPRVANSVGFVNT